ncbi:ATP-dependent protease LonB [Clostridium botulinum]|uniref:endopeptidase La n=2 Tax=Clostridium botulinum TaxID=1491 RepID=A0A846I7A7_CLOBO|nr:ATP-dependent protease LonB [Clostridium botulinum]AJD29016.1 ATP-dependent protease LonB [Clostridium botulinum CDC_297]EPS52160.1 ATP-dependent protease LonB [Clostridium botulinum A1 str. CFSAN002368]ACQ53512.1 ATP-dependent protease LonB [Clostridium botulinum Ba4 str. 657]AJE09368.1 ATP-dependent protease LonB [Clostridium botulinum CDC_1436]APU58492.1 ATP-dependent protease LonB [Clostridium botulinum]
MTQTLVLIEIFFTVIMGLYFMNALKSQKSNKVVIEKENKKEIDTLKKLRSIKLTEPLTEKSRPSSFDEIIGQENGIKALKAAICSPNPQHVIIYGPPGTGKTAAARLILEDAKKKEYSPFNQQSKFMEIDATTVRSDERGIADPLIGSVHDPIYQGAGALGLAGVPQPKPGAVTKAHGGILFIDEIGELHPSEMNKLLKVLEDRKVFLDSAYYNPSDNNIPSYIKDIFENGLPADFRLIGATTRSPEEITPALRSRCVEVFFRALLPEEIKKIAMNAIKKLNFTIEEEACELISKYCSNGRDTINLVQLSAGLSINSNRNKILIQDVEWVIENGQYSPRIQRKIPLEPKVGYVNGLAVYGANMGMVMEIEATAKKINFRKGNLSITGLVEEEEINSSNKKAIRKSTAWCSVQNVITIMKQMFDLECDEYDIHINFPGGIPVDGPSAGISITTAVYSAIIGKPVDNNVAMTGEISIHGEVKPVGGVSSKVEAAIKAGAKKIIIPKENWQDKFEKLDKVKVIPVSDIKTVIKEAICVGEEDKLFLNIDKSVEFLSAESMTK